MGSIRRLVIIAVYVLIFWVFLPAGLLWAGQFVDRALGVGELAGWLGVVGGVAVGLGLWICIHATVLLRTRGRGLPISSLPPTQLVTSGPYRFWRHPIYTGYTLLLGGVALLLDSPGTAFVVMPAFAVVWFATWVRLYEEPLLVQRFGGAFRVHRRRTGVMLPFAWQTVGRSVVRFILRFVFRFHVEGSHNVPRIGPVVLVSDHVSYLDFMFAQYLSHRPILIPVTAEVFRQPLRRVFIGMMGGVPKRRFCPDPAAAMALADQLAAGGVIGIAIEGERSWTGKMGAPALSVARNISRFDCTVVPAAFVGAYRLWPRWAGGSDRRAHVTIRLGEAFQLGDCIDGFVPGDAAQAADVAQLLVERISALRDPDEPSVELSAFPDPRPELTLWRCPICFDEECLGMQSPASMACSACGARWSTAKGDLVVEAPPDRAGERHTVAGWAEQVGGVDDLSDRADPLLVADGAELREDPHAQVTLGPLTSLGDGRAELHSDRLLWRGAGAERTIPLVAIRSVSTERNDTLQLGVGLGVVQIVFRRASPLRWQLYVLALKGAA